MQSPANVLSRTFHPGYMLDPLESGATELQGDIKRNMQLAHTCVLLGSFLVPALALSIGQTSPFGTTLIVVGINIYVSSSGALHWASSLSCALSFISYAISLIIAWLTQSGAFIFVACV